MELTLRLSLLVGRGSIWVYFLTVTTKLARMLEFLFAEPTGVDFLFKSIVVSPRDLFGDPTP